MKIPPLTISARLILLLLFTVILSTSLVGAITYYRVNQDLIKEELKQMDTNTLLLQSKIQDKIETLSHDVLFLAQTPPIRGIIRARKNGGIDPLDNSTETIWRERLATIFSEIENTNPDYFQVRYIGLENDGLEIVRVDQVNNSVKVIQDDALQAKGDRSYFRESIVLKDGAVYLSHIELNREHGKISVPYTPVLRAATPVYAPDGKVFGIVIINLALNNFFDSLASLKDIGQSIYATNQAGEFLIHPDKDKTFRFEFNGSYKVSDEFPGTQNHLSKNTDTVIVDLANGKKTALGFRKVYFDPMQPQRYLNIVVSADYNNIIADALTLRNEIIGMLVFLVLLSFILAYFSSRPVVDEICKLSLAVEHSPDSVIIMDANGTIEYVNRKFKRLTGYSKAEVLGKNINILKSGETPEETYTDMWETVRSGREWRGELLNRKKNGDLYWEALALLPIITQSRKIQHIVGLQENITQQKQTEENLYNAKKTAEEANKAKSQFVANMSHELRTPLNAIIGYSEMLQEEAEELKLGTFSEDLNKIQGAGRHLLGLINDILDLSKIEAGKVELEPESFPMEILLEDIKTTITPLMEKNSNELQVECDDSVGELHTDQLRLRQVLFNLLSNAAKFTKQGNVTLTVIQKQKDGQAWVDFAVRDTGIGMNADQLKRLFTAFVQADASISQKYGGTGLGLVISRKYCELLGGTLEVESREGKGSVFTASLPAVLPGYVDERSEIEEAVIRLAEGTKKVAKTETPLVLVIDDDQQARELLQYRLTKMGFQIVTASDGPGGIRLAREHKPAAILLDIIMPGMDGWAVLEILKNDQELHDIPVVVCSIVSDLNRGFSLGAVDYLIKPVDKKKLVSALERFKNSYPANLLVVDDNEATRKLLVHTAQSNGWNVREAENGKVCLQRLSEQIPNLMLLDLMMPELDGFGVIEAIDSKEEWNDIPIIVITAKDLIKEEREWLQQHVFRILEKSEYSKEDLLNEITDQLIYVLKKHGMKDRIQHT